MRVPRLSSVAALLRVMLVALLVATGLTFAAGSAAAAGEIALAPDAGNDGTTSAPSWTFARADGAGLSCAVTPAGTCAISGDPITGFTVTLDLAGRPNGTYAVSVTDASLAPVEDGSASYVLAVPVTITAPVFDLTNQSLRTAQTDPTWSWTDGTGTTECRLTTAPGAGTLTAPAGAFDWRDCTGEALSAAGTDGSYTLSLRGRDGSGNYTAESSSTYVKDNQATAADVSVVPTRGKGDTATWTWSESEAGSTCLVSGVTTDTSCNGSYIGTLTVDGVYTLTVEATDAAGNQATSSASYERDNAAVDPTVTVTPAGAAASDTPVWTITPTDPHATTTECMLTGPAGAFGWSATACAGDRYAPTVTQDGTYTLYVRTVDDLSNVSPGTASAAFTRDRTADGATFTLTPPARGTASSARWTWTTTDPATACSLTSVIGGTTTTTALTDPACAAGDYTATGLVDGRYTLSITTQDSLFNETTVSASYERDNVAGPAAFTATPPARGTGSGPAWSWTVADPNSRRTECQLTAPAGATGFLWQTCAGGTYTAAATRDGSYTFEVRSVDDLDNVSTVISSTYERDNVAGPAGFTATPPARGTSTGPTWSWTVADPNSRRTECQLTAPAGVTGFTWQTCAGGTYTAAATRDGSYTFEVRSVDDLDNVSTVITSTYERDNVAGPAAFAATPPARGTSTGPTWSWTVADPNSRRTECQLTAPAGATGFLWQTCAGGTYTAAATRDGSYTFEVRSVDDLDNVSTVISSSFVRDLTGPDLVSGPALDYPLTNGTPIPRATFTRPSPPTDTDHAECRVVSSPVPTADPGGWATCLSPWAVPVSTLATGQYLVQVRLLDDLGNVGATGSAALEIDKDAPTGVVVVTSGPGPRAPGGGLLDFTGRDDTPTWTFDQPSDATAVQCRATRGATVLAGWQACPSNSSVTLPSLLTSPASGEGTYTLELRGRDAAGNPGPVTTSTYLFDLTPPTPTTVSISSTAGPGRSVTVTWGTPTEAGVTAACTGTGPGGPVACTSGVAATVPDTEGTYSFTVRYTDAAGNTTDVIRTYLYDHTGPAAPGVSAAPVDPIRSGAPSFTLTPTEPNERLQCTWTAPAGATPPPAVGCGTSGTTVSPVTYAPAPALVGDGIWTLAVVGYDVAGNASAETTRSFTLDTTGPDAPLVSVVGRNPGSDQTPSWSWSTEPRATTECRLTRGTTILSDWASCLGSAISYSLASTNPAVRPDGSYTVSVRATDVAGNLGAVGTASYLLDTIPPGAPVITSTPASPSNVSAPAWSFGTGGDAAECRLLHNGSQLVGWGGCSSPASFPVSADGDYVLEVRAVDAAGNIGPSTASTAYLYDASAPDAPILAQQPASPSPEHAPEVGFTIDELGAVGECRVSLGGTPVADWTRCTSPWTADLTGLPDADYDLEVRAVDPAGNPSRPLTVRYILDSTAPPTATFTSAPTGPSKVRVPSFSFSNALGTTAECATDGPRGPIAKWAPCSTPFRFDLTGQPDGSFTLSVRLVDAAGNRSAVTSATYKLDTVPPAAPVLVNPPGSPTNSRLLDWRWTGELGARPSCQVMAGSRVVDSWRACTSPYRMDLTGEPDGSYRLLVRLTDAAGNTGPTASGDVLLDTGVPLVHFSSTPPSTTTSRSLRWTWTTEPGVTTTCLVTRGQVIVSDWSSCSGSWSLSVSGLPDGEYRLHVQPVDRSGTVGPVATDTVSVRSPAPAGAGGGGGGGGGVVTPPGPGGPTGPVAGGGGGVTPAPAPSARPVSPTKSQPTAQDPLGGGALAPVPIPPLSRIPEVLGRAAVRSLDKPQLPIILVILVVLFLLVQNRIDRRDPKLAHAPLGDEPMLTFGRTAAT